MRRRISFIAAILLCATAVLAGCGTKDANSVVKDLDQTVNKMESYHGSGTMTLHTGQQPLEYQVDVSYQKPQYYRIELTNAKKDISQIVLRNDEGVFVLTPRLNKVFRFQSDWPANQGQVYLYQTLVSSILLDNSRQFTVDKDNYVFDVMANYQNGSLARQKIWLNKADYAPSKVEVSDTNASVMVEVKFNTFEFGSKLDKSVFDTQRNMESSTGNQPTMAHPEEDGSNTDIENDAALTPDGVVEQNSGDKQPKDTQDDSAHTKPDDEADGAKAEDDGASGGPSSPDEKADDTLAPAENAGTQAGGQTFTAMEPSYLPEGVSEKDQQEIVFGGNPGFMIRYTGDYDYTLIETQPHDQSVSLMKGEMVDLGFTLGQMSGDEQKTLTWTYNGIEFRITSATLPDIEMVKVAQSVQGEMSK
ncbi:DUF4367 domain-containing protein [Paenibacillus nasutitermitis]|uniref:Outer membrane lipoprotein-sorting protein n=1 Tax=Paenibacillus nasutitermitis TaxID=1652958 RepID=A0A916ZKD9_9BACL|nr:DUF4367 domain-containing protein [Paenibacillus nasutitermitis]GGE01899.1 hypothetical protein GCM10010911_71120 [Paenibacillus nasutitermitis]